MIYFNPGCALNLYKPQAQEKLLRFLKTQFEDIRLHTVCCHYEPRLPQGTKIINVCAGCDKRFGSLYAGVSTLSLWEVIDGVEGFPFPDYGRLPISVQDPCPVRNRPQVHAAVRSLLDKMNFRLAEPAQKGKDTICCGDSSYPHAPLEEVHQKMQQRAGAMPCADVCVYCVSCINAIEIGGKKPRYLLDLLLGEDTKAPNCDIIAWHEDLKDYRMRYGR